MRQRSARADMLLFRCTCISSFPWSLGTFFKQFPASKPTTAFFPYKIKTKALTTTTTTKVLNSYYFDTLTSHQNDQIRLYVDTLLQWNQKMNLTAVTEVNEVMERHIKDSLSIIPTVESCYQSHRKSTPSGNNIDLKLVDVGSGPGLPGLVLAIARPSWEVTLMESMNKRCVFLEQVIGDSGLSNVQVVRGRAESFGQNINFREQFDVAVARAVAEMRVLAEYCLPFVRVGGLFVAAKGHDPYSEVDNAEKAIELMGGSLLQVSSVESHSPYGQRTAIVCLKARPTPKRYPRDPGTPARLPL